MKEEIIKLNHITYKYEQENVLEDINLTVREGDFLAIVGPNGSGKSTLLKLLLGINRVQQGDIYIFGEKITVSRAGSGSAMYLRKPIHLTAVFRQRSRKLSQAA